MSVKQQILRIPKVKVAAADLSKGDRVFWKALQETKKDKFTLEDLKIIAKIVGCSTTSMYRHIKQLRGNGKVGTELVYNLYY